LQHVGDWLATNGEAIYGTRPWKVFGEGPTKIETGDFKENTRPVSAADVRFTTKGDTLYAIFIGWPADGTILIKSLSAARSVEPIGDSTPLNCENRPGGIVVHLPARAAGRFAYVLRIKQS